MLYHYFESKNSEMVVVQNLKKLMYLEIFNHYIMVTVVALLGLEGQVEVDWRDD
jgi:hypothetical protein